MSSSRRRAGDELTKAHPEVSSMFVGVGPVTVSSFLGSGVDPLALTLSSRKGYGPSGHSYATVGGSHLGGRFSAAQHSADRLHLACFQS